MHHYLFSLYLCYFMLDTSHKLFDFIILNAIVVCVSVHGDVLRVFRSHTMSNQHKAIYMSVCEVDMCCTVLSVFTSFGEQRASW